MSTATNNTLDTLEVNYYHEIPDQAVSDAPYIGFGFGAMAGVAAGLVLYKDVIYQGQAANKIATANSPQMHHYMSAETPTYGNSLSQTEGAAIMVGGGALGAMAVFLATSSIMRAKHAFAARRRQPDQL